MKTVMKFFSAGILLLVLTTCTKKKFDFEFIDSKCRNFKIDYARVQNVIDPSCSGSQTKGELTVKFDYNGDKDCIKGLNLQATFYNSSSGTISGVDYPSSLTDSDLTIDDKTVTFTFTYEFATTTDADAMNYLIIKMATVNELNKESNTIQARYNSACFVPDPSTYTDKESINIDSPTEILYLYDHAADDGDIVSVYVNGDLVVDQYRLTNSNGAFSISVSPGDKLIIYAMNQGSSGPNTVGFTLNGVNKEVSLETDEGFAYTLF